ncbi:MAG: hypothetical protein ACRDKU_00500 [Gaiellaceae bacterium]
MARVLLGVTGGIAAYKACELTAGEPMVPPRAPSFTPLAIRLIVGSGRAKPGSAQGRRGGFQQEIL